MKRRHLTQRERELLSDWLVRRMSFLRNPDDLRVPASAMDDVQAVFTAAGDLVAITSRTWGDLYLDRGHPLAEGLHAELPPPIAWEPRAQ